MVLFREGSFFAPLHPPTYLPTASVEVFLKGAKKKKKRWENEVMSKLHAIEPSKPPPSVR